MRKTVSFILAVLIMWTICSVALYLAERLSIMKAILLGLGITIVGIFAPIAIAWITKRLNK